MATKRKSKSAEPVPEVVPAQEAIEETTPTLTEAAAVETPTEEPVAVVDEPAAEIEAEETKETDEDLDEEDSEDDFDGDEEGADEDEDSDEEEEEIDGEEDSEEDGEEVDEEDEQIVWENDADRKLERLQKILAQAGVSSRRRAEELIEEGHVQVNGQIVTTLGAKADPTRDHIRVDGKLLHGPERQRYFLLNKPKGFVTTVTDPEKRPTVMQFFTQMKERLYPVGRLDYLSEGLLLVTNDGEVAHKLTRAASGVEKTYLVKISGQPSDDAIEQLREGVTIQRDRDGGDQVRTAPARIRQVRKGDNPWFEVVLTEGRNRELRKMFEKIGHFVEKIRRIGYGPLVLDVEPGTMRELTPDEVEELRAAAAGQKQNLNAREKRMRRQIEQETLPTVRPTAPRRFDQGDRRTGGYGDRKPGGFAPRGNFGGDRPNNFRPKPYGDRPQAGNFDRPRPTFDGGEGQSQDRPTFRPAGDRPRFEQGDRRPGNFAPRPGGFADRKPGGFAPRGNFGGDRPNNFRPKPYGDRPQGGNFDRPRPTFEGGEGQDRPSFRPAGDRPRFEQGDRKPGGFAPRGNFGGDRPNNFRPKPYGDRPQRFEGGERPQGGNFDRPRPSFEGGQGQGRPSFRPTGDRPSFEQGDRKPGGFAPRPGGFGGRKPGGFVPRPGGFGGDRPNNFRPKPYGDRPQRFEGGDRPQGGNFDRPRPSFEGGQGQDRPAFRPKPYGDRPQRPVGDRPRFEQGDRKPGGFAPRPGGFGGDRPNNFRPKPYGDRPQGNFSRPASEEGGSERPRGNFAPRTEGAGPRGFAPKKFGAKPGGFGPKKFGSKPGGFGPKKFGGKPGGFKPKSGPGGFKKRG